MTEQEHPWETVPEQDAVPGDKPGGEYGYTGYTHSRFQSGCSSAAGRADRTGRAETV